MEEKVEEEYIDIGKIIGYIRKNKRLMTYCLLALLVAMGFTSRIGNIPNFQRTYLISMDDPYIFYRYANYLVENGYIPKNDTLRYHPIGFDTTRELLLPSYVGAGLYFIGRIFSPSIIPIDAYHYYAPLMFAISLIAFFFLAKEFFEDERVGLIATGLFAFSNAILFRTAGGFLDKEPIATIFIFAAYFFFLKAVKEGKKNRIYIYSILFGISTGVAHLAWGGALFIYLAVSAFVVVEVLLDKFSKEKLIVVLLWFLITTAMMTLLTARYGIGWFKGIYFLSSAFAMIAGITALYIKKPTRIKIPEGMYKLCISILLAIVISSFVFGFEFIPSFFGHIIDKIAHPMGTGRFQMSVSENQPPFFYDPYRRTDWWSSFGYIFLLFFFGSAFLFYSLTKEMKEKPYLTAFFSLSLLLFAFGRFSTDPRYQGITRLFASYKNSHIVFALIIFFLVYIFLTWKNNKEKFKRFDSPNLFLLVLTIIHVIAATGAVRLFFSLASVVSILAGYCIVKASEVVSDYTGEKIYSYGLYLVAAIIILLGFNSATAAISRIGPGMYYWKQATDWISSNTSEDAVFIHWWDYGYWVQFNTRRATVTDPGNFYGERNYDVGRFLFGGSNQSDWLYVLEKYGKPDYLLVCSEDVFKFYQMARIGYRDVYYSALTYAGRGRNQLGMFEQFPEVMVFEPTGGAVDVQEDFELNGMLYAKENTYITRVYIPIGNQTTGPPVAHIFNLRLGEDLIPINCICSVGTGCLDLTDKGIPSCMIMMGGGLIHVPKGARDMLMTRLYLLREKIPGFELVYETEVPLDLRSIFGMGTNVRIYKINYTEFGK